MMRELAVIVSLGHLYIDNFLTGSGVWVEWGYRARVVEGTIDRYNPSEVATLWRPTAAWAKTAGDAWIRRARRREERTHRRERRARRATGYEKEHEA